jgi:hypothetical protein
MEVSNSVANLAGVESGEVFFKSILFAQVGKQLSTTDESHDEKDFLLGLENILHADQEGMLGSD